MWREGGRCDRKEGGREGGVKEEVRREGGRYAGKKGGREA